MIFVIAVLGLNILTGFSGQLSLGHGAFIGVGAYVAGVLIISFNVPYLLTIPAAGIVCAMFGYVIGFPALRLQGHYLALATFGLALSLPQVLKHKSLEGWTGGAQGLVLNWIEPPVNFSLMGVPMDTDRWLYMVVLMTGVIVFTLCWNLLRGRVRRAFISLRDHPTAAETMGVSSVWYKTNAFAISAALAGISGALLAITTSFVAPDSFPVMLSIGLLVGSVVGGISTVFGALFGGLFVEIIPEFAHEFSKSAPTVIYGGLLLVVVYIMPDGLVGLLNNLYRKKLENLFRKKTDLYQSTQQELMTLEVNKRNNAITERYRGDGRL